MDQAPAIAAPETISANLRTILGGLLAAIGGWGVDAMRALMLYRRIGGLAGRIERMLRRFRAGRLWRVMDRTVRVGAIRKANCTLPRRFGWLVQAGGHRAAAFGSQLQAVLNTEEMSALLAASPQAGRLLRPLCRALAVALPASSAAPRPTATRRWAAPIRRPEPEKFRIPLPRGVLAAARREGFGKQD